MEKNQVVALTLALAAVAGTAVNLFRRTDVQARLAALEPKAGATGNTAKPEEASVTEAAAQAELKRLQEEVTGMKADVEKVKAQLGSGSGTNGGTGVKPPDGATPLRPEDVVRIMDEELNRRWEESKRAEIRATLKMLDEKKKEFTKKLKKDAQLSDQQSALIDGVLADQVAAYGGVLNDLKLTVEERRERVNAISNEADEKAKTILDAIQFKAYETMNKSWHGLHQIIDDAKREGGGKR